MAKNLSTALARINLKTEKATEKASILAKQLKETSLSLMIVKKEKAIITPRNKYIICRLITPRV
jgi:hypothetical protein